MRGKGGVQLHISDTFTASLARLAADEQKAVKTTVFDLHVNPDAPGHAFHKLDRAKDKRFWSVRVNRDVRIIVHRSEDSLLLCYVDHHDRAYQWAERRKVETHPRTGAAQLVELRETVTEIVAPVFVAAPEALPQKVALFATRADDELLAYGVPPEWLADVRAATEDSLLGLVEHLPGEAVEALLELATGGTPPLPKAVPPTASPLAHPDAQRRFRVVANVEELERALDFPWERWTVFLHPAQRQLVERSWNGPARISGSAGTGKTVVALHRAVHLARRDPEARVLLTTFSDTLARALTTRLRRLIGNEPRIAERLEVGAIDAVAERLFAAKKGRGEGTRLATADELTELVLGAAQDLGEARFSQRFLVAEWTDVVDAWQLGTWEAYRDVPRLGRKTRLPEKQRSALWQVFERVRQALANRGLVTRAALLTGLAQDLAQRRPPFDHVVVDEAQDLGVAHLRFLGALGGGRPNGLTFTGDLGQRIFQQPFSWRALGVDIRGRSATLRVNYRTSHQIRAKADRLLGVELRDADGNAESRTGTVSVFNGPAPEVVVANAQVDETKIVADWLRARLDEGFVPHELAVFVRSPAELPRARAATTAAQVPDQLLDERVDVAPGAIAVSTMHLAKGLEFRGVVVMACDDEVIPLQTRIEAIVDEADLEEVYSTERHLLYVACTRARDRLLVTSTMPASEFLEDLAGSAR